MTSPETHRLEELLAEIDRLCAEAAKIREKLGESAGKPAVWPPRREDARLFDLSAEPHDLATSASGERRN